MSHLFKKNKKGNGVTGSKTKCCLLVANALDYHKYYEDQIMNEPKINSYGKKPKTFHSPQKSEHRWFARKQSRNMLQGCCTTLLSRLISQQKMIKIENKQCCVKLSLNVDKPGGISANSEVPKLDDFTALNYDFGKHFWDLEKKYSFLEMKEITKTRLPVRLWFDLLKKRVDDKCML